MQPGIPIIYYIDTAASCNTRAVTRRSAVSPNDARSRKEVRKEGAIPSSSAKLLVWFGLVWFGSFMIRVFHFSPRGCSCHTQQEEAAAAAAAAVVYKGLPEVHLNPRSVLSLLLPPPSQRWKSQR